MGLYETIEEILDHQASSLVGILMKKVETLDEEDALTPSLYKSLARETIYQRFRVIKDLLAVYLKIGTVIFKYPEQDSSGNFNSKGGDNG